MADYIKENFVQTTIDMEDGPDARWFDAFRRRHPKLKVVNLETLSTNTEVDSGGFALGSTSFSARVKSEPSSSSSSSSYSGAPRRDRVQYQRDLERAVSDVQNHVLTPGQAQKQYNIQPWIIKKNLQRVDATHERLTRVEVPDEWEPEIVEHCLELLLVKGALNRNDIATKVRTLIKRRKPITCFNPYSGPSDRWFHDFLAKHPDCTPTPYQSTLYAMTSGDRGAIDQYFQAYENLLMWNNLWDKPARIYSCCEVNLGHNDVLPDDLTVFLCCGASGKLLPHYSVKSAASAMDDTASSMTEELFIEWFNGVFLKYCSSTRPLILVLDNRDAFYNENLQALAARKQILLLYYSRHLSCLLQPLECGITEQLHDTVYAAIEEMIYESSDDGELDVDGIVRRSLAQICEAKVIRKTFKLVGLSPLNPQGIYDPRDLMTIPDSKRRRHELPTAAAATDAPFFKQEPGSNGTDGAVAVTYSRDIPEVSGSETCSSSSDEDDDDDEDEEDE